VGRRLAQAGPEINFLIRHRRAAELSQRRLRIVDGTRTQTIDARTVTLSSLAGPYDLVLIGVNAQALPATITDFTAAVARTPSCCRSSTASVCRCRIGHP